MVRAIRCHRQNTKTSIINGPEVSRLSVAIHTPLVPLISFTMFFLRQRIDLPPKMLFSLLDLLLTKR